MIAHAAANIDTDMIHYVTHVDVYRTQLINTDFSRLKNFWPSHYTEFSALPMSKQLLI